MPLVHYYYSCKWCENRTEVATAGSFKKALKAVPEQCAKCSVPKSRYAHENWALIIWGRRLSDRRSECQE